MPNISDPFTLVYDNLLDIVKQSKGLEIIVASLRDKIISLNTKQGNNAIQSEPTAATLPEIILASNTVSGNFNFASNAVQITRLYQFLISTDAGALGETIYPLEWGISCAMVDAQYDVRLRELAWHNYKFVKALQLGAVTSGESNADANRGIQGWAAIWQLNVNMLFPQSMMRQFNQGAEIITVPV